MPREEPLREGVTIGVVSWEDELPKVTETTYNPTRTKLDAEKSIKGVFESTAEKKHFDRTFGSVKQREQASREDAIRNAKGKKVPGTDEDFWEIDEKK